MPPKQEQTPAHTAELGPLGLPLDEAGELVQAIARVLVDRDHDIETVRARLRAWAADGGEPDWWEAFGGDIVDRFADQLDLAAYPDLTVTERS